MSVTHLVSLADWDRALCDRVLARAAAIKARFVREGASQDLAGKSLGMIFHKPSLRTRVSFEAGMRQLGGGALFISDREIGMNTRETIEDIARVLSGYVEGIMIRTFDQDYVDKLAANASIPVIKGLTDLYHPCQILADLMTAQEAGRSLDGLAVAYVGDGNNVAHSWINAAIHYRIDLRIAHPAGYAPDAQVVKAARQRGAQVTTTEDPRAGVEDTDVVYTDVWASMGQEEEKTARLARFDGFQVNADLMAAAKPEALFMHCLPAHRGEEVSAEVIDGPQSVVFPEAHNRLHAQKGLLVELMGG
jgi:ornithine carbamoyltransferase